MHLPVSTYIVYTELKHLHIPENKFSFSKITTLHTTKHLDFSKYVVEFSKIIYSTIRYLSPKYPFDSLVHLSLHTHSYLSLWLHRQPHLYSILSSKFYQSAPTKIFHFIKLRFVSSRTLTTNSTLNLSQFWGHFHSNLSLILCRLEEPLLPLFSYSAVLTVNHQPTF